MRRRGGRGGRSRPRTQRKGGASPPPGAEEGEGGWRRRARARGSPVRAPARPRPRPSRDGAPGMRGAGEQAGGGGAGSGGRSGLRAALCWAGPSGSRSRGGAGPGRAAPRGRQSGAVRCRGRSRTALGCGCAPRAAGLPRAGLLGYTLKLLHSFFSFSSLRVLGFLPSSPPGIYLLFLSFLSGVWAALCAAWSCAPSFLWVPSEWGRSVMLSCAAALGSLRWWGVGWGRLQRSVLPPWLCDSVRFWDFKFFGFRVPLAGAVQRFTLKVLSMVLV